MFIFFLKKVEYKSDQKRNLIMAKRMRIRSKKSVDEYYKKRKKEQDEDWF